MTAVYTKPRQNRMIPRREESQANFVHRANRELYRKIPDALKRNRYILKCWRDSGRDGRLASLAAERFPENKYQTVHDLPIFPEHSTVGSDGKRRVYDRKALEVIVKACNDRILDTGDFAALTRGHTPDDPTSAHAVVPEVLGYEGPFRLGMVGNLKPKWCIFADEHHRRDKLSDLEHRPRRSAEVWLEDNILDPIAALGAETPRLDTGIVRNCRLPSGRTVQKYSAIAAYPGGMNTSPQSFGSKPRRETYAAGDSQMPPLNNSQAADPAQALQGIGDESINAIVQGVASLLMQSKPMQWVQSQMPPDWTPGEGESDEIPPEHADLDEGLDEGLDGAAPAGDDMMGPEAGDAGLDADPGMAGDMGDGLPPEDVGAAAAGSFEDGPDDEATPDEIGDMDEEDRERYAAHDSAGRKGFLQAWRRHGRHRTKYSAGEGNGMPRSGQPETYSRLENRVNALEKENRTLKRKERHSRLANLANEFAIDPDEEIKEVEQASDEQFEAHCNRIVTKYARLPVARGQFSQRIPVEQPEVLRTPSEQEKQVEKYSRRAMEIAQAALKANPRQGMSWNEAMAQARQEIDGTAAAK